MAGPRTQLVAVFERATGPRLGAAERFVRSWPGLLAGTVSEWELCISRSPPTLIAVARFEPRKLEAHVVARFAFWTREAGGSTADLDALSGPARAALVARVESAPQRAMGAALAALPAELDTLLAAVGVVRAGVREAPAVPVLHVTLGAGAQPATYDPATGAVTLRTRTPLPLGDRLAVSITVTGEPRPFTAGAKVTQARVSGEGAGFTLSLVEPCPALDVAHDAWRARLAEAPATGADRRVFKRYPIAAPSRLTALSSSWETDGALAADWVANLSLGGALVRTATPPKLGEKVRFEMRLPNGQVLATPATVVRSAPGEAGVQFELDAESKAVLEAIVSKVSQRSRRALIVDDDALLRAMLSDALIARGFEVLVAETGERALQVLLEELFGLDVLVTDLWMPQLDGESLARRIRIHGGEQELIIMLMTGRRPEQAGWLSELKIDGVLDKSIGARAMALAIEAQVEQRRGTASPPGEHEIVRLSYPTTDALLEDAHTLQMGGAFAAGRKLALHDEVTVHLVLPDGSVLRAPGEVISVEESGVGVTFELPAAERETLTAAIAKAIEASMRAW